MPATLLYLFLTIMAEVPVHLIGLRGRAWPQVVLVCILLNGFTLPLATGLYFRFGLNYVAVEAGVVLVEAFVLWGVWEMKMLRAILLALLANAASIALGAVLGEMGLI